MSLLDVRLDYKAIKVIRDLHLKCIIIILLSFVDCGPRPYHGGFTLLLVPKIM